MASLAPSWPPSKAAIRRAACCCWRGELALPPPVSSSCPSTAGWGGSPRSMPEQAEPPVTTWEQWPGWAGGGVGGRAAPSVCRLPPATGTGCWEVCSPSPPPPCLVFHLAGHTVSHGRAKENRGLRKCLWAVAGVPQLWEVGSWGRGPEKDLHCTGCILPGTVAKESRVCFPTSTLRTLSPCILVSSDPADRACQRAGGRNNLLTKSIKNQTYG